MRSKLSALILVIIAVLATFGANAYTTGSVSRAGNVDVVTDDVGLIALQDGTSGGLIAQSNGKLTIDMTRGGASGVNADATFKFGDPNNAGSAYAFTITNQDTESHDFTVSYTGAGATGDGTNNIEFQFYDSSGSAITDGSGNLKVVSEETTSTSLTGISSGETIHVVLVIDTTGLDSTNDLSGTLKVSA